MTHAMHVPRRRVDLLVLAVISYAPLLLTHWGRLNADTKLYLGEDPAGLMARSVFAWDPSQFGGFVPHQAIAYLWPSGPFYWVFDTLGTPQWIIQRLWLGTIFFAASTGVAALLRWHGFSRIACVVAALFFQASPYVLPYQSRTSSMLLPFAAVGWLSYMSARGVRSRSWLWPALIALTMFTVASVNATATLMVLPAPVIVALHALDGPGRWRSATRFVVRTAALTVATSAWWIVMLLIQSRHGADLLTYSETLADVASTSNAFEVFRGFGYWLNYVGLDAEPLTTAARIIIESPLLLAATTLLPLCALVGVAVAAPVIRRLGAWLVFTGLLLAVGVHPLDDALPLFGPLADDPTSTLALALRSSTRAIPVMLLGLSIGIATLIDKQWEFPLRLPRRRLSPAIDSRHLAVSFVGLLIVLSNPTKWVDGAFEPTLERSPIPASWRQVADQLDAALGDGARIMQFPGQEFGAYTWGHTIDPAWPAVSANALLTRDLIPLGSTTMMNVLWETDRAVRQGRLTPDALETMANYLHSQGSLFPGDLDDSRYGTPTQSAVLSSNGLTNSTRSANGEAAIHAYAIHPTSTPQRASTSHVVLLGDGRGLVDAAIADATRGHTVLLSGHVTDPDLPETIARSRGVVVTDTNTERAQQWRTSSSTVGFDEDREGLLVNFFQDPSDIRMRIFGKERPDDKTWFTQVGPVRARVSSYGPPLAYRPELRAYAAIDGDPSTSWQASNGASPAAPVIQLLSETLVDRISLLQPQGTPNRIITQVSISEDAVTWIPHALGPQSLTTGQLIALPFPATSVVIRIDATRMVRPLTDGEEASGVGFAEIGTFQPPTSEVGVMPTRGLVHVTPDTPLAYVMTRRRAPISTPNRTDVESTWLREFFVPDTRPMRIEARIDSTDMDEAERQRVIATLGNRPVVSIDDRAVRLTIKDDGSNGTIVASSDLLDFDAGTHSVHADGLVIDQVVISDGLMTPATSMPDIVVIDSSTTSRTFRVPACPTGCWLEFGQGHNTGWHATADGYPLDRAVVVNGGVHGWRLPPSDSDTIVRLRFTPQRTLSMALLASLAGVVVCAVLVLLACRRGGRNDTVRPRHTDPAHTMTATRRLPRIAGFLATFLVMSMITAPWVAATITAIVTVSIILRRAREAIAATVLLAAAAVLSSLWEVLAEDPARDFAWSSVSNGSHRTIIASVAVLALLASEPTSESSDSEEVEP